MPGLFDTRKQLVFYGAYHNNATNVLIHMIFVPVIVWSFEVLINPVPLPSWVPRISYQINDYLAFSLNASAIYAAINWLYYFSLEPVAALIYLPQYVLSLLTATAFAARPDALKLAGILKASAWVMQFIGHGVAEKRAPALLDNLLGATVLAPFFVHLELLFKFGYRPDLHRDIQNGIGMEIAKLRKTDGDKKRAAAKKEL